MKHVLILAALLALAAGYSPFSRTSSTTEKNRIKEKEELSPIGNVNVDDLKSSLVEVSEDKIPEGALVYVLEEAEIKPQKGETLKTADNLVFRPLFQYRNRQEAQQRRRIANGYRRRYFIQRRPYRNTYSQYYYNPYNHGYNGYRWS